MMLQSQRSHFSPAKCTSPRLVWHSTLAKLKDSVVECSCAWVRSVCVRVLCNVSCVLVCSVPAHPRTPPPITQTLNTSQPVLMLQHQKEAKISSRKNQKKTPRNYSLFCIFLNCQFFLILNLKARYMLISFTKSSYPCFDSVAVAGVVLEVVACCCAAC